MPSVLFLIIQLLFVIYLFYYIITFVSAAPFVPSSKEASRAMIRMAQIQKGKNVYDLGSGDGRLLFLAAEKGAHTVGYELNFILILVTLVKKFFSPYKQRIDIRWQSLWKADIRDADIVFVYLLPMSLDKLQKKLTTECRPGTVIVSNSFIFKNWPIVRQDKTHHIFVFRVGKRVQ